MGAVNINCNVQGFTKNFDNIDVSSKLPGEDASCKKYKPNISIGLGWKFMINISDVDEDFKEFVSQKLISIISPNSVRYSQS